MASYYGTVRDKNNDLVQGRHVRLIRDTDRACVNQATTNAQGEYEFEVFADEVGVVTFGSVSSIQDSSQNWTVDEWAGYFVIITSGALDGQNALISSNTATTLSLDGDLDGAVAEGDTFAITSEHTLLFSGEPDRNALVYSGVFPENVVTSPAAGGTITQDGDWWIHTFEEDGNFVVQSEVEAEYLIVAGGGGGGAGTTGVGGGGGAGGIHTGTTTLTPGTYGIEVGDGGVGTEKNASDVLTAGTNGGNSVAFGLTALGGGRGGIEGGTTEQRTGAVGGSGGGSSTVGFTITGGAGTEGQGFAGGNGGELTINGTKNATTRCAGGGGGASEVGANVRVEGTDPDQIGYGGDGGDGIQWPAASGQYYGGGGGGGGGNLIANGTNPLPGTGGLGGGGNGLSGASSAGGQTAGHGTNGRGGGGGGCRRGAPGHYHKGGNGGSGVVIIRYQVA